jgi:hypothetical protein
MSDRNGARAACAKATAPRPSEGRQAGSTPLRGLRRARQGAQGHERPEWSEA